MKTKIKLAMIQEAVASKKSKCPIHFAVAFLDDTTASIFFFLFLYSLKELLMV